MTIPFNKPYMTGNETEYIRQAVESGKISGNGVFTNKCQRFFEDLCAPTELQAIEQRFSVARMLHEGRGYAEILKESGASSATVSRVNRALNYSTGGMKELMERMDEKRGIARPREDEE